MSRPEDPTYGNRNDVYFAELLVTEELLRTHGITFAAEFLAQFEPEIHQAASRLAQRRAWSDFGNPTD